MNAGRQLVRLGTTAIPRHGTRSYVSLERIKELQAKFQKNEGLPVHLKKGGSDRILTGVAIYGTIGMTLFTFYRIYKLINKTY